MERTELDKTILANIDTSSGCVHCNPIKAALDLSTTIHHETKGRKLKDGNLTKGKIWNEYVPNKRMQDAVAIIRGARGGARAYVETSLIELFGGGRPKDFKEDRAKKDKKLKVPKPSVEKILLDICKNITDYTKDDLNIVKMCGEKQSTVKDKNSNEFKKAESEMTKAKLVFHAKRDSELAKVVKDKHIMEKVLSSINQEFNLTDDFKSSISHVTNFKDLRSQKLVARKGKIGD